MSEYEHTKKESWTWKFEKYRYTLDVDLEKLIAEKYGKGWTINDLDLDSDEIAQEFVYRLMCGY